MDELYVLLLTDNDATKVATIIANVPNITSPQQAVSWALNNVEIPSGQKPIKCQWVQANADALNSGTVTPIREPGDYIRLPTGHHVTEVVKIPVGNLSRLNANAIMEIGALRQIASSRTDQVAVLQDAKLGVLE
jgi:hypothetical protein